MFDRKQTARCGKQDQRGLIWLTFGCVTTSEADECVIFLQLDDILVRQIWRSSTPMFRYRFRKGISSLGEKESKTSADEKRT